MADQSHHVVASATAVTVPNYNQPRLVEVPPDRPGIVIFLHGVCDPGATYENVERGICEGLNWRLNRTDLTPGVYGADWAEAKVAQADAKKKGVPLSNDVKSVIYDPDSNLYKRVEVDKQTNSVFVPFYWGYRAKNSDIKGEKKRTKFRGQYQDKQGNRLDTHFAREGGYFDNATNNIPDMYGAGFQRDFKAKAAQLAASDYQYIGNSPERLYYVLAAHRLAMLIREIRAASPGQGTNDETITVIGHSQGTIITLLAQAILAAEGSRPLDTMIMVDTPYAVWENGDETQTSQAKIKTLANIVQVVTAARHTQPPLAELSAADGNPNHHGRTGPKWSPKGGIRPAGPHGAEIPFIERDNRGKVYLYFCADDQVVALNNVRGLGTYGLPDTVSAQALGSSWFGKFVMLPAMQAFKKNPGRFAFYQRMWTKQKRDGQPVLVGLPPQVIPVRTLSEPVRPGVGFGAMVSQHPYYDPSTGYGKDGDLDRWINGEAIQPPYAPRLQGGETRDKQGKPSGQLPVDAVTVDAALGNPLASGFQWFPLNWTGLAPDAQQLKTQFNQGKDPDDQTQTVRVKPHYSHGEVMSYTVEREETPNEAQARLANRDATENSYHSGILNDAANLRAVAAMDVAIGQAKTLDDPDWRALLMAIADWRTDWRQGQATQATLESLKKLSPKAQALAKATSAYYWNGKFPDEGLVPRTWPSLVKSQTKDERAKGHNDPGAVA